MPPRSQRILAILTVRNEAAFLLEWLTHHRASGFTEFLVFSGDCQDGTDKMLARLQEIGWLTHVPLSGTDNSRDVRLSALRAADRLKQVRKADWILPLDVDEFVNIHTGDRTVAALLNALPDATAITLTRRLFGNADVIRYDDSPVTETFTRCAPAVVHWPWHASKVKTLVRNDGTYRKLGVHRPRNPDRARSDGARWYDSEGRRLDNQFKTDRIHSDPGRPNHRLAQLNHYALGAKESFLLRRDRGRPDPAETALDLDHWVERNFNMDTDTTISALAPARDALRTTLMEDPRLAKLHGRAVAWRRDRFRQLMEHEPSRAFFARLLMTPQSRALSDRTVETLSGFANLGRLRTDR